MESKKDQILFWASIAIIIAGCFLLYELHGYVTKLLWRHEFIVMILDTILYGIFFFALCAIGPIRGWLNYKFDDLYLSDKYGKDWKFLSEEERATIDIILKERNLPKEDGALPEIHEEAIRIVKEKRKRR